MQILMFPHSCPTPSARRPPASGLRGRRPASRRPGSALVGWGVELEPHAAHGLDEARPGRGLAELAQVADMHVDDVIVAVPVATPDLIKQLGPVKTRPGLLDKAARMSNSMRVSGSDSPARTAVRPPTSTAKSPKTRGRCTSVGRGRRRIAAIRAANSREENGLVT